VTYESGKKLIFHEHPDASMVGIILAIVSLILMPILAFYKKKIATEINSRALRADALETLACSYLSLTLILGLGANALFGWWWADPLAALAMVYFLVGKDGRRFKKVERIRWNWIPINSSEAIEDSLHGEGRRQA
jgi:divalent metal cation (Fe/Co/Zn/Cd) transporter